MIVLRWLWGMIRAIGNWSQSEWFYYAKTGLDPRQPAFERWEMRVKDELKAPENEKEELLRPHNYKAILHDKFMLTPEDVIFFTSDKDKVDAVEAQYNRELGSRSCGDFYYRMVKGRQLDFFHDFKVNREDLAEDAEVDEETRREMFIR